MSSLRSCPPSRPACHTSCHQGYMPHLPRAPSLQQTFSWNHGCSFNFIHVFVVLTFFVNFRMLLCSFHRNFCQVAAGHWALFAALLQPPNRQDHWPFCRPRHQSSRNPSVSAPRHRAWRRSSCLSKMQERHAFLALPRQLFNGPHLYQDFQGRVDLKTRGGELGHRVPVDSWCHRLWPIPSQLLWSSSNQSCGRSCPVHLWASHSTEGPGALRLGCLQAQSRTTGPKSKDAEYILPLTSLLYPEWDKKAISNWKDKSQVPEKTMFILFPSFQRQHDSDHSRIRPGLG